MTKSEEKAAEKFTLRYYVKGSSAEERTFHFIYCLNFAAFAHIEQKRKDSLETPYINHPIGVAYILSEEAGIANLDLLRGCLLHDTVEDTPVVIEMIRAKFGDYIGDLVQEVSDDKSLPKQERKDLQIKHASSSSDQAKMVKLADKLYNLRDLDNSTPVGWTEERRKEYYKWAFEVCEGLRGVNDKLEEELDKIFQKRGLMTTKRSHVNISWPAHDELKPLIKAANFAAQKHSSHFVFDTSNSFPYINHVVSVAFIVCQEAHVQTIPVLCAALLYSVIGKSDATVDELQDVFGSEVANLVNELTYDHTLPLKDQFYSQIKKAGKMSQNAKVITLATLVDKCRRLEVLQPSGWTDRLREDFFQWSFQLSKELSNINEELEKELNFIWIGQGLQEFPMETKEEPRDI